MAIADLNDTPATDLNMQEAKKDSVSRRKLQLVLYLEVCKDIGFYGIIYKI